MQKQPLTKAIVVKAAADKVALESLGLAVAQFGPLWRRPAHDLRSDSLVVQKKNREEQERLTLVLM